MESIREKCIQNVIDTFNKDFSAKNNDADKLQCIIDAYNTMNSLMLLSKSQVDEINLWEATSYEYVDLYTNSKICKTVELAEKLNELTQSKIYNYSISDDDVMTIQVLDNNGIIEGNLKDIILKPTFESGNIKITELTLVFTNAHVMAYVPVTTDPYEVNVVKE